MARPPEESVAMLKRRAVLLTLWRLTPDQDVRETIETELYGGPNPGRAAAEAERLSDLAPDVELNAGPSDDAASNDVEGAQAD